MRMMHCHPELVEGSSEANIITAKPGFFDYAFQASLRMTKGNHGPLAVDANEKLS